MGNLSSQLESILFVASKPLKLKELCKATGVSDEQQVAEAMQELIQARVNSGVVILDTGTHYQMATNSRNSEIVKNFLTADLKESLTEATTEVLAIIAYRQPISKAEIEAIRGVNSQYSLRALLMRGLIEKVPNPSDARGPAYQVTTDFLQQLGISSISELPKFEDITATVQLPETASGEQNRSTANETTDSASENSLAVDNSATDAPVQPPDEQTPDKT